MDNEVVAELSNGTVDDARGGLLTTVALARKALQVLRAVLRRLRSGTDSGVYTTVIEELLRAFYLGALGGAVWQAMKQETMDGFLVTDDANRGARRLLNRLAAGMAGDSTARVTLVGHSTGAVFINNFLHEAAQNPAGITWPLERLQVLYLAPACTTERFAATLDDAEALVGRFRMFTMTDEAETNDRLVGAIYPRSLLYLVSGLLERNSPLPLLGLARYLNDDHDDRLGASFVEHHRLARVRDYIQDAERLVLSPSIGDGADGANAGARSHGDFDDDDAVLTSLQHLIRTW